MEASYGEYLEKAVATCYALQEIFMISATERDKLKEDTDCRPVAEKLMAEPDRRGSRTWLWKCPFHEDRDPSLAVWQDGWHCFGCRASGDIYDLVMRIRKVQFAEAHVWLLHYSNVGGSVSSPDAEMPGNTHKPAQGRKTWQDKQDEWRRLVDNASFRLDSSDGEPGQKYLQARCIQPETWHAWSLGYVVNVQRWKKDLAGKWQADDLGSAISIPWTNGPKIKAVQYRLLKHKQRFHQESGGERTLFGVQHIAGRPVLILVEGEINAVSIWQEAQELVDVASFGPEGNVDRTGDLLRRIADRYQQVVVWADKPKVAREAERVVEANLALRSPEGLDANDLLRRGQLRAFIIELFSRLDKSSTASRQAEK